MKILLIGHACSPGLGSEPGVTWNWAWQLSQQNEVWVITHPEYRSRVEAFLDANPNPRLHILWTDIESHFDRWTPGQESEKGIRLHYWLWLKEAYSKAANVNRTIGFDVLHHVSWTTVSLPPPLWRVDIPSVWGPVGGAQFSALRYLPMFGRGSVKECIRTAYVLLLPWMPALRRTVRSASLVFATNHETKDLLVRAGARRVELFLDGAYSPAEAPAAPRTRAHGLTLLWAGRIVPQKGLLLALRALAACRNKEVRLLVAGAGSGEPAMKQLAQSLGLKERVEFLGRVPHEEMLALFDRCDALLFTSIREAFGTVILEAAGRGLPLIGLDHQGIRAFVPDDASIKIPAADPASIVRHIALACDRLAEDPARLQKMSMAAHDFAFEQTADKRTIKMMEFYRKVIGSTKQARVEAFSEKE